MLLFVMTYYIIVYYSIVQRPFPPALRGTRGLPGRLSVEPKRGLRKPIAYT